MDQAILKVLPDFTLLAKSSTYTYTYILPYLLAFTDLVSREEGMSIYQISDHSFWRGSQVFPKLDFIKFLKDYSEDLPSLVSMEIMGWGKQLGRAVLRDGNDVLVVSVDTERTKEEVLSSTGLRVFIDHEDGLDIYFKGITRVLLAKGFLLELAIPLKGTSLRQFDFRIEGKFGIEEFQVKSTDPFTALKTLFNKSQYFHSNIVALQLNKDPKKITSLLVNDFMTFIYDGFIAPSKRPEFLEISIKESFL